MLSPTVRQKEMSSIADARKLCLQKEMYQNIPRSTRVGDKLISVNEFKKNHFTVDICEVGRKSFHGQAIQFSLTDFQNLLSNGPIILAEGIKNILDRIRDDVIKKINEEVDVLIKEVKELQDKIDRKVIGDLGRHPSNVQGQTQLSFVQIQMVAFLV